MKKTTSPTRLGFEILFLGFAIFLSACSLAGDITPPPGARSASVDNPPPAQLPTTSAPALAGFPTVEPVDVNTVVPAALPNAAEGGLVFADHCAECHGPTGAGDGTRSAQLMAERTAPLPNFSAPDLARAASPAQWFKTITEGRLEKFMPPWADKLSETDRWNAIAFLYTLSVPSTTIESGQAVYTANCAQCHGATGQGDGPQAAQPTPPDLTVLSAMVKLSPQTLFDGLLKPQHTFDSLTEDERWAVTSYLQTFAYAYAAPGAPIPEHNGTLRGTLLNGTAGASTPAGISINLHGFDVNGGDFELVTTLTTTAQAEGAFAFEAVPYRSGRQFLVTAKYGEVTYSSAIGEFDAEGQLDLPVKVYETTAETAALRVQNMHVFMDFSSAERLDVVQVYVISNLGDRTITGDQTFELRLPPGAQNVTVRDEEEGQDYSINGDTLMDTLPIVPGASAAQLLVSYSLPYAAGFKFEQPTLYPVTNINLLLSDMHVQLMGAGLDDLGQQQFQGQTFQNFGRADLPAGEALTFEISGDPTAALVASGAAAPGALAPTSNTNLAVGLGAVALVLIGAGVWWLRRGQASPTADLSQDDLLEAIAELDDEFAAGKLDASAYERERADLKAQLLKVWRD